MTGKITEQAALTAPDDADVLVGVDVSDTTMAASGTTKKLGLAALQAFVATGLITSSVAAEPLTSGEAIFPRFLSTSSFTPSTGVVYLTYWVAASSGSCTGVTTYTGATPASGLTYANIGVYSVNASTGNLTLLQSTGDIHTTAWLAANTPYTTNWASSGVFTRTAGNIYALAVFALGLGGTMPALSCYTGIPALLALPSPAAPATTAIAPSITSNSDGQISTIASWAHPSPGVLNTIGNPITTGYPASGTILVVASGNTYATVTYTGRTSSSFTGCAYVSGSPTGNTFAYAGIYPSAGAATGFLAIAGTAVDVSGTPVTAVVAP